MRSLLPLIKVLDSWVWNSIFFDTRGQNCSVFHAFTGPSSNVLRIKTKTGGLVFVLSTELQKSLTRFERVESKKSIQTN